MSLLKKRSMNLNGHATSVALEPEFWEVIDKMAAKAKTSIAALIVTIDEGRGDALLASACRLACLRWALRSTPARK